MALPPIGYGPFDSTDAYTLVQGVLIKIRSGLRQGLYTGTARSRAGIRQNKAGIGARRAAAQMLVALYKGNAPVPETDIEDAIYSLEDILDMNMKFWMGWRHTSRSRSYDPAALIGAVNKQIKELQRILRKMQRAER